MAARGAGAATERGLKPEKALWAGCETVEGGGRGGRLVLAGVERPELDWLVEPCCADMTEVGDTRKL